MQSPMRAAEVVECHRMRNGVFEVDQLFRESKGEPGETAIEQADAEILAFSVVRHVIFWLPAAFSLVISNRNE